MVEGSGFPGDREAHESLAEKKGRLLPLFERSLAFFQHPENPDLSLGRLSVTFRQADGSEKTVSTTLVNAIGESGVALTDIHAFPPSPVEVAWENIINASEGVVASREVSAERTPPKDEVLWCFQGAIGETPINTIMIGEPKEREDEKGLCFLEIMVNDGEGQREYTYERKRQPDTEVGVVISATIYTTCYNEDGMPTGGESLAKLVNGNWRVTPRGPFETTKRFV